MAAPQTRHGCGAAERCGFGFNSTRAGAIAGGALTGTAPARRARRRRPPSAPSAPRCAARGAPRRSAGAGGGCCAPRVDPASAAPAAGASSAAVSCRRRVAARSERSVSTARSRSCSALGRRCSAVATACSLMRRCSWSAVWVIDDLRMRRCCSVFACTRSSRRASSTSLSASSLIRWRPSPPQIAETAARSALIFGTCATAACGRGRADRRSERRALVVAARARGDGLAAAAPRVARAPLGSGGSASRRAHEPSTEARSWRGASRTGAPRSRGKRYHDPSAGPYISHQKSAQSLRLATHDRISPSALHAVALLEERRGGMGAARLVVRAGRAAVGARAIAVGTIVGTPSSSSVDRAIDERVRVGDARARLHAAAAHPRAV